MGRASVEPRMSEKFKVGDKAVYPGHGVAHISGVEWREIAGTKKQFYILKIVNTDMKVLIPVDNLSHSGLRCAIDKERAPEVFEVLRDPTIAVTEEPWNRKNRIYLTMLASGSLFEVAKVLRDLHCLSENKKLSRGQNRLYDQARNLLVSELSLTYECDREQVDKELQDALDCVSRVRE